MAIKDILFCQQMSLPVRQSLIPSSKQTEFRTNFVVFYISKEKMNERGAVYYYIVACYTFN